MTLLPSTYHRDEFVVSDGDARDVVLATAVGARRFNGQLHLTRVRANKFHLLRSHDFEAVATVAGWRFRKGGGHLLALHRAILCIEVMATVGQPKETAA